ncbi:malonic semialdehyde reductase, partial [Acinetobacter baumannii]|nr:malonic semialdehyde reductase [Acinetobacter baumannii]
VRALGLDAGPMTGADFDGIAAEFFEGTDQQPFLVVNLGYGVAPEYPRGTRFAFDDVTRSL